jgi:hypothetical protein
LTDAARGATAATGRRSSRGETRARISVVPTSWRLTFSTFRVDWTTDPSAQRSWRTSSTRSSRSGRSKWSMPGSLPRRATSLASKAIAVRSRSPFPTVDPVALAA